MGESFTLTFSVTPSFVASAVIVQDGTIRSTCIPTLCFPTSNNNVKFTSSGTGVTIVFNPVSSSHEGNWQFDNSSGDFAAYLFSPKTRPG